MNPRENQAAVAIIHSFLLVLGVALLQRVTHVALVGGIGFLLVMWKGRNRPLVFLRLAALLPVLLLLTLPLLLAEGWPPTAEVQQTAALLALRMLASALILTGLLGGRRGEELVEGLGLLKMPPVMIQVLLLSYRYFMMIRQDVAHGRRAMKARGVDRVPLHGMLPVVGEWIGGFFLKSMDHSEKVHQAMKARGFGQHPGAEKLSLRFSPRQMGSTTLLVAAFTLLILLERGVLP